MQKLKVQVDVTKAVADLRNIFWAMEGQEFNRRMAAVLNEVRRKSYTDLGREIRRNFPGIKLQTIKAAQSDIPASASKLRVVLITKGRPIPINQIRGSRQTAKGITYNLTGTRQRIARAFVTTLKIKRKNKQTGEIELQDKEFAMARGKYVRGRNSGFLFMKGGRYPMDVIRTVSVPGAQTTKDVGPVYMKNLEKHLEKRAEHVIRNAFTKRTSY